MSNTRQVALPGQAGSLEPPAEPLVLAIDASSTLAGLAISRGSNLLASLTLGIGKPHSQILFPAIQTITAAASIDPASIDLFAAVAGPGGFTGLRVGLSVVAGLADGYGKPTAGHTTFDLIALNSGTLGVRLITISAGRGEVYCGLREILDATTTRGLQPDVVCPMSDLPAYYREIRDIPGLIWVHDEAAGDLSWPSPDHRYLVVRRDQVSLAATLARVAASHYQAATRAPLHPYYIRRPDAELKRPSLGNVL
jgi:tRNA threonylcarbamoyl adenosine modification protein YeaZ